MQFNRSIELTEWVNSDLTIALMFLIPRLWCIGVVVMSVFDVTWPEAMRYTVVDMVLILILEIKAPLLVVSMTLSLLWLFLLGYPLGWIFKPSYVKSRPRSKRRTGSKK